MHSYTTRPMGAAQTGVNATVKWFNSTKGFGFVAFDDGTPDAFLHISVVERAGLRDVLPGTTMVCDVENGPKGPQVSSIETIDTSAATVEPAVPANETIEGVVKFFSAEKGFGFVTPDAGGKDVFVGIGALQRSGLEHLDGGQRVRMLTRMGKKGPMAQQVDLI